MYYYNSDRMSSSCKVLYSRGLYFIQTGTAQTFTTWAGNTQEISKRVPIHILKRIGDMISKGDTDSASTLWMRVCELIDSTPITNMKQIFSIVFHATIAAMAIYAFVSAINK